MPVLSILILPKRKNEQWLLNQGRWEQWCHAYLDVPDAAHVHPRLGLVRIQGHSSFIALSKEGQLHVRSWEAPEVLQNYADLLCTLRAWEVTATGRWQIQSIFCSWFWSGVLAWGDPGTTVTTHVWPTPGDLEFLKQFVSQKNCVCGLPHHKWADKEHFWWYYRIQGV